VRITEQEFQLFQRFMYEAAGITLPSSKKELVSGRLAKRLEPCGVQSYGEYFRLLKSGNAPAELQTAIDLLTTNETYFFREEQHFELLGKLAAEAGRRTTPFRVWSAASSSGEEAYSIAMVLQDRLGARAWEVIASDISARVLARARTGHYRMQRTSNIPPSYLKQYCLKGIGAETGTLLITRELRNRVRFSHINLNEELPHVGMFDVIFLRNVMIYFNTETKREVVSRLVAQLQPDGHLFIGRSETLNGVTDALLAVAPSIYRRRDRGHGPA
jgi:chemotaxis protein methyltransferase CheR